jgi:NTP pyrophosphatase (non-canonical NTP hydrolase)
MTDKPLDRTDPRMRLAILAQQMLEDSMRWFGESVCNLNHVTLGLCGESGELANLIKKLDRGDFEKAIAEAGGMPAFLRHELAMEAVDVLIYTLLVLRLLGVDPDAAYQVKRQENEQRFGPNSDRAKGLVKP